MGLKCILIESQISIQALYDYKSVSEIGVTVFDIFQFKHCTIISIWDL